MIELRFGMDTRAAADFVFDTIVDLRGYDRWLGASMVYSGMTEVSADRSPSARRTSSRVPPVCATESSQSSNRRRG